MEPQWDLPLFLEADSSWLPALEPRMRVEVCLVDSGANPAHAGGGALGCATRSADSPPIQAIQTPGVPGATGRRSRYVSQWTVACMHAAGARRTPSAAAALAPCLAGKQPSPHFGHSRVGASLAKGVGPQWGLPSVQEADSSRSPTLELVTVPSNVVTNGSSAPNTFPEHFSAGGHAPATAAQGHGRQGSPPAQRPRESPGSPRGRGSGPSLSDPTVSRRPAPAAILNLKTSPNQPSTNFGGSSARAKGCRGQAPQ